MKSGIALITEERERQVSVEGWSAAHDDNHVDGSMAAAAAVYAAPSEIYRDATAEELAEDDKTQANYIHDRDNSYYALRRVWPWMSNEFNPKGRIRDLVRAGALIAAEIDRIQRCVNRKELNEAAEDEQP